MIEKEMLKTFLRGGTRSLLALLVVLVAGCSGPLKVAYSPRETSVEAKAKAPVSVLVESFADSRDLSKSPFKDPRTIGRLDVPVSDMTGNTLTLSEDVAVLVTRAYANELALAGYIVKTQGEGGGADFIVSGAVKDFRASVGARDEVSIVIATSVEEAETGRVIWSGESVEKGDRFAGVMGNSRSTLSNYIGRSLSKAIRASLAEAGPMIANTSAAYAPVSTPSAAPVAIDKKDEAAGADASEALSGTGRIVITTAPSRSKVYIDDVYYGLTPLTLDIAPGVYEFTVKQKGYKSGKEKASVREGKFIELEVEMERE